MIRGRLALPLSPPTTPRMPDSAGKANEHQWQNVERAGLSSSINHYPRKDVAIPQPLPDAQQTTLAQAQQTPASLQPNESSSGLSDPRPLSDEDYEDGMLEGDDEIGPGTVEESDEADRPPMTAEELRAHKRKMKRFRLTHNQTRFLVSEFARHPHPDAAHRERLSREIPGLSPRQVQVWFQNRRAKLKRLTADDRERMIRSRALPADFDTKQALHSSYAASTPKLNTGTGVLSSAIYKPTTHGSRERPQALGITTNIPPPQARGQHYAGSTGVTPAMTGFAFTPPQSARESMASTSAAMNASQPAFYLQNSPPGQRFSVPSAAQAHYDYYSRAPWAQALGRQVEDLAGSPSQLNASYPGVDPTNPHRTPGQQRTQIVPEHPPSTQWRPLYPKGGTNAAATGLGSVYPQVPLFQPQDRPPQSPPNVGGQPPTSATQPHQRPQYPRRNSQLAGPSISYAQQPSTLASPQEQQYYHFGTHPGMEPYRFTFQAPGIERPHQQPYETLLEFNQPNQPAFTPLPSQSQRYTPRSKRQAAEGDDNDEGGVPLPTTYWDMSKSAATSFA